MQSVRLICTYTEGPTPIVLHIYYQYNFCLWTFRVKNTYTRLWCPLHVYYIVELSLIHNWKFLSEGQCLRKMSNRNIGLHMPLTLVRSNITVTIQYSTSGYNIQQHYTESCIQLILLLTISSGFIHFYLLIFHNGWTLSPDIIQRASGCTSVLCSTR